MRTHAIIFDLDGTLLDTIDDLTASMNAALASLGFPTHDREAYKIFVGDGVRELVARAFPEAHRDDATVARGMKRMREEYRKRWADATKPYDGILEMLDALAARNIPTAILSNKPEDFTRTCVDHFLDRCPFAIVRGARDGTPKKPDPAAAIAIAQTLGFDPKEILFVGDTCTDMRTAVAAGMIPVGVLWGFRGEAELRDTGAQHLIAHPSELVTLLT